MFKISHNRKILRVNNASHYNVNKWIFIIICLLFFSSASSAQNLYYYSDFYNYQYFIDLDTGKEVRYCRNSPPKGFGDVALVSSDNNIFYVRDDDLFRKSIPYDTILNNKCEFRNPIKLDLNDGEGTTNLSASADGNLFYIELNNAGDSSYIWKYNYRNDIFTVLDTLNYRTWAALTFYNGYLVFGASEGIYTKPRLVFYDLDNKQVVKVFDQFEAQDIVTTNMSSFANPCMTEEVLFVSNQGLRKFDFENEKSDSLYPTSSYSSGIGASTKEYLASMPEVMIDSIIVTEQPDCGNGFRGSFSLVHRKMRGRGIRYDLMGHYSQTDSIFTGLSPGKYVVEMVDTIWGCTYLSDTIHLVSSDNTEPPDIDIHAAYCDMDNGIVEIHWDSVMYQSSLDGSPIMLNSIYENLTAGQHELIIEYEPGCRDTIDLVIERIPLPTIDSEVRNAHCGMEDGVITITDTTGKSPLKWKIDDGNYGNISIFNHLDSGTYVLTVRDSFGCEVDEIVEIENVSGPDILRVDVSPSSCGREDGNARIVADGITMLEYKLQSGGWQGDPNFDSLSAGGYEVFVRDTFGCMIAVEFTITDADGPQFDNIEVSPEYCSRNDGRLVIQASGKDPISFRIDSSTWQNSGDFNQLSSGSYTLTIRDSAGCITSQIIELPLREAPIIENINIENPHCDDENGKIELNATSNTSTLEYLLNNRDIQEDNTFYSLGEGSYILTVIDSAGCTTVDTVILQQTGSPEITIIEIKDDSCGMSLGSVEYEINGGTRPYRLYLNDEIISESSEIEKLHRGEYILEVRDSLGCQAISEFKIHDDYSEDYEVILESVDCDGLHKISIPELVDRYYIIETDTIEAGNSIVKSSGRYTIYVPGNNGECGAVMNVNIPESDCNFYIPNAFSPNGDGINDIFTVYNLPSEAIKSLKIYDRWGEIIYENSETFWDGEIDEVPVGTGVYVYKFIFEIQGIKKVVSGDVTVLR